MDKELLQFLMSEHGYNEEDLQEVYNMEKQGKEIADRINNIYRNRPDSMCKLSINGWCSRCPIKRIQQHLDDNISMSCEQVYILLQLLKEGNK